MSLRPDKSTGANHFCCPAGEHIGRCHGIQFWGMISHASLVAQIVLGLLVFMSIGSWALMIQKFFSLSSANRKALRGIDRFDKAPNLRDAVQSLGLIRLLHYIILRIRE